ncbi:MAG: 23S rRNA (guanosine(2251)-2'-O)-methyltransferase RlmB [Caldimicrobium sp.]
MSKVIWGINPLLEVLKTQPHLIEEIIFEKKTFSGKKFQILEKAKKLNIPIKFYIKEPFCPPKVPKEANTQGVVAYLKEFHYASLEEIEERWVKKQELPLVVALDEVVDPQNVGSILRVSDALGAHGVILQKHRACEITSTVIKVSSGSAFHLPVVQVKNLKEAINFFSKKGLWIIGLSHKTEMPIFELDLRVPLLIIAGNEAKGIRPSIIEKCDFLAKIPMLGKIESLNVAQATAIALYEVLRQRIKNS